MAVRPSILVVDDEHTICDLLADLLIEEGYLVRRAYDGLDALAEVERKRPDLVLSDVALPSLNGADLAVRLRARGIPVVLLSAAFTAVDLPGVPFLRKPFDLDRVLEVVDRSLTARAH